MSRKVPNIDLGTTLKKRDRLGFKQFVLDVNIDTFIYSYTPTEIILNDNIYFTLYLRSKRFVFDLLEVDNVSDYIDVYLFGVKQPQDRYNTILANNDIIITFTADITRVPADVKATDFEIKGKIAEIV
jgi:hypothetical protein